MMQKTWKMTETLAHWYSSESAEHELSNRYQHDADLDGFKNRCTFAFDESSLSIGRVKS